MLGIEHFGNLEHYCFEKYDISEFASPYVTSLMTSYRFKKKLQNLANDVIIVSARIDFGVSRIRNSFQLWINDHQQG